MSAFVIHIADMAGHVDAVYIGRQNNRAKLTKSPLANPFQVNRYTRPGAIFRYSLWLQAEIDKGNKEVIEALIACRDRPLACWCREEGVPMMSETACHGDIIIELLERFDDDQLRAKAGS